MVFSDTRTALRDLVKNTGIVAQDAFEIRGQRIAFEPNRQRSVKAVEARLCRQRPELQRHLDDHNHF